MSRFFKLLTASLLAGSSMLALAKLPAPSDEVKAKALETAAKASWSAKVDAYQLCKSQDKVAASYYAAATAAGKPTKLVAEAPACADPGVFVYAPVAAPAAAPVAAKPVEAAGAHSPAATAASPPSTRQPDAVINPANLATPANPAKKL
jgi:hypothetical protein